MDVHIALDRGDDLTTSVYRQLAAAIVEGALAPGERLPPTRGLAADLGIARNTVAAAYDRLLAEGLTTSRVGSGTFVADIPRGRRNGPRRGARPLQPTTAWSETVARLAASRVQRDDAARFAGGRVRFDFGIGTPDAALFPRDDWRREIAHQLRPTSALPGLYADPAGSAALRSALARHVRLTRAVDVEPDDVLITHGAQHGIALAARVLLRPGDEVAVEDPGYPPIRELLLSLGARVVPVPVDAEGLRVDRLPDRAALVYTTPSHQFPTGVPLSPTRRAQLLDWAAARRAAVIEDDYDSEFRYGTRPLDSLHGLDRDGRVVYVGTFSKSLLPSLRLGFLIAPASMRPALLAARRLADWHGDPVPQEALAALLASGRFAASSRAARAEYTGRHRLLSALLAEKLGDVLEVVPAHAGLHLTAWLSAASPRSARRIVERAADRGIRVSAIDDFYVGAPARSGFVLGFGGIGRDDLPEAVDALEDAVR